MNAQWKLLECFKVIKTQPSTSLFMSLAIFAVIATVANVAKIAFEDRSLVVNFFLFVTIIQVCTFTKVSILTLSNSALEKHLLGLALLSFLLPNHFRLCGESFPLYAGVLSHRYQPNTIKLGHND